MSDAVLSFSLTLVVGLVSAVVVSRLYGVSVIGEFALVAAPFGLVGQFSNLGEQAAFVRAVASEPPSSRRAVSLFLVVLAFSSAFTVVTAALVAAVSVALLRGPVDQPGLVGPALVLVVGYVLLGNVSWNADTVLAVFRRTRALMVCRVLDAVVLLALSVVLAYTGARDVGQLVVATVGALAVGLLPRLVLLRRVLTGRPDATSLRAAARELPAMVRFGVRIVPGSIAHAVTLHAATWLIGSVRSVAVLGAYSRANNLASRLIDAGYRLAEVLLPTLSRHVDADEHQQASDKFAGWQRYAALGLVVTCAPAAGSAEGVLGVFGPDFSSAWAALGLLLLAYGAGILANMNGQLLLALHRPGLGSRLVLLRAAVALTLIAPLTFRYGTTGAALATAAGYVVGLAFSQRAARRVVAESGAQPPQFPLARLLVVAVGAFGVARVADLLSGSLVLAFAALAAGVLAAVLLALAVGLVRTQDVRRLVQR